MVQAELDRFGGARQPIDHFADRPITSSRNDRRKALPAACSASSVVWRGCSEMATSKATPAFLRAASASGQRFRRSSDWNTD